MPQQIDDLPPGLTIATLQATLNDRIKVLNLILNGLMTNPADRPLDMANFLINDLADPVGDLDAVNLRTLRRQGGNTVSSTAPAASSSVGDAYTIVYNVPGFLGPDELIPAYVVGRDRTGKPAEGWIYALGPPTVAPVTFNFTQNGTNIFSADATLPLNSNGPVFSTSLVGGVSFKHGDVIELAITGGSASGLSFGLVVERG